MWPIIVALILLVVVGYSWLRLMRKGRWRTHKFTYLLLGGVVAAIAAFIFNGNEPLAKRFLHTAFNSAFCMSGVGLAMTILDRPEEPKVPRQLQLPFKGEGIYCGTKQLELPF